MKKGLALFIITVLLAGGFGVYAMTKEDKYANIEVGISNASFNHHDSVEELEKESELVVVGQFTGKRETLEMFDSQGIFVSNLTKSTVKVEKVLKGDVQIKKNISVFEDCYLANDRYIGTEGYKWMNEDGRYLLFLIPGSSKDSYVIVGIYEGKFDLNLSTRGTKHKNANDAFRDPDVEFLKTNFELEEFYQLKEQALKKYNL